MAKKEIGTLAELNVKPGDVVECMEYLGWVTINPVGKQYTVMAKHPAGFYDAMCAVSEDGRCVRLTSTALFRIVSRASDAPKTWSEMTDEEQGALLLADHRGEVIEWKHPQDVYDEWDTENLRFGISYMAYRVRPPEPKRETVTAYVYQDCGFKAVGTIDLIDGKLPAGEYRNAAGDVIIVEEL